MPNEPGAEDLKPVIDRHCTGERLKHIQPLTGGVSADVYRLDLEERTIVLRVHGATHSGHPAQLEFDLLNALFKAGVNVAKPLAVDDSCTDLPAPYLLLEFVEGSTAVDEAFQSQSIEKMADTLRQIHALPYDALSLPELPKRLHPVPEVFNYLPEGDDWLGLKACLQAYAPPNYYSEAQIPRSMLHGDFWPENVMWREGEIAAVLDWEDAAIGDPLSDVASCSLELRYLYGQAGSDQFLKAYGVSDEFDQGRLILWQIYVASAAQKYMGLWGLPEAKEAHMRKTALEMIRDNWRLLTRRKDKPSGRS